MSDVQFAAMVYCDGCNTRWIIGKLAADAERMRMFYIAFYADLSWRDAFGERRRISMFSVPELP